MVNHFERSDRDGQTVEPGKSVNLLVSRTHSRLILSSANSYSNRRNFGYQTGPESMSETLQTLNAKVQSLIRMAPRLSKIDICIEEITAPLAHYSKEVILEPLGREGPSFRTNDANRTISLNRGTVLDLAKTVPKVYLVDALLIFLCHEVAHIAQGLKNYEDVQRFKRTSETLGRERVGELDLRSDFLAVHTLSLHSTLKQVGENNPQEYVKWFHKLWNRICIEMLNAFPAEQRIDKQQRVFGFLLMSNLTRDAHLKHCPLEFNREMWPVWNESLDCLSISSCGKIILPGSPVEPQLMKRIIQSISKRRYEVAAEGINQLWSSIPRR